MDNLGFGVCEKLRRAAIHLMLPFVVLFAISASAGEKPSGSYRPLGQPQAGEVITGPIPRDSCIVIYWTGRSPSGYRYTFPIQPISIEAVGAIARLRARGEIVVFTCKSADT